MEFHCYNSKASSRGSKTNQANKPDSWDLSSAGRASALQAEGHRFEPCRSHIFTKVESKSFSNIVYGEIAQLARAHGSYPWCRGFKSLSRYLRECMSRAKRRGTEILESLLSENFCSSSFYRAKPATDRAKLWKYGACQRACAKRFLLDNPFEIWFTK